MTRTFTAAKLDAESATLSNLEAVQIEDAPAIVKALIAALDENITNSQRNKVVGALTQMFQTVGESYMDSENCKVDIDNVHLYKIGRKVMVFINGAAHIRHRGPGRSRVLCNTHVVIGKRGATSST